jgi:hypothetical protein
MSSWSLWRRRSVSGGVVSGILIGGKGGVVGPDDDDGNCRALLAAGVDATVAELAGIM